MWFTGFGVRVKFYFAWKFAEFVCIASGLGFNGYDPDTNHTKWDLIDNINVFKLEVCSDLYLVLIYIQKNPFENAYEVYKKYQNAF
jgi:lysophospholipid acyltransferase